MTVEEQAGLRGPATRPLTATPGQRRMWFLDRFDAGDPAYNVFALQRLDGQVDVPVLRRALAEIVRRHEPLRTRFVDVDGEPVPEVLDVVADGVEVPFEDVDLRGHADPAGRAGELARGWSERPFDLATAPLLRAGLARTGDEEYVLGICVHHIVADGWSMSVLRNELAALYAAFLAGRPSPLEPLTATYRDHLARRATPEQQARAEASLDFWADRLSGAPMLSLPTDRSRPDLPAADRGAVHRIPIPAELVAAVRRAARANRCTPFMVWLAAYQVLLCRFSGQEEVCVGVPAAGRGPDDEALIGYFSTTLVLRADLTGDPALGEAVRRTRTAALAAYAHPDLPFEEVLARLRTGRDGGRNPLYQCWFNVHTETLDGAATQWAPGLSVEWLAWPPPGPGLVPLDRSYDLAVDLWPASDALYLSFSYDRELFDPETVADLADRYLRLVEAVSTDPELPVSQVSLLREGERGSVLTAETGTVARAEPGTVVDMVLEQARRTPAAAAVVVDDEVRSYADLVARSGMIAHAVGARTAAARAEAEVGGPDAPPVVVGVCVSRSADLVASLLGTMQAGAAYLPLDPAYPDARLEFMLRDSGAVLVLTDGDLAGRLGGSGVPVVRLADLPEPDGGDPDGNDPDGNDPDGSDPDGGAPDGGAPDGGGAAPSAAGPGRAAYVIYTSGSTGVPKGVPIEHGGLAARVRWMRDTYPITADDRVLQFASVSFDTHAEEVYPVLAAGGTLVIPTVAPELLPEWLPTPQGRSLTVLDLPTAYWHRLVHDLEPGVWPPDLRLVIIGGAEADAATVGVWRERFGDRPVLLNTYGPTEATIVATASRLGADDATRRPSIGTPAAGTAALVLDGAGRPVPVGVPGELYLAGAGVARGYLGRPELSAQRFPADPDGGPGARRFRTGDRVRLRRDGGLEFLGRTDRQAKIRGFRIEPGEVEAALHAHPDVAEAAAVVRDAPGGSTADPVLVAYLVARPGLPARPAPADLRRFLEQRLPAHLVPTAFVLLDRLPLTPNGKLDAAALPAPSTEAGVTAQAYVEPRTDGEALVASIWAEVLDLERVGALDDFFDLGGHSLLATRVTARLRSAVGIELPLRVLFTTPSVAEVALAVEDLLVAELDALSDDEVSALLATDG